MARDTRAPRRRVGARGLAAGLSVVYLAYRPFPEWWYLRFLLPAVALSLVLASAAAFGLAGRWRPAAAAPLALAAIAAAAVWAVRSSEGRDAFGLQRLEQRFPLTAAVVAARLPSNVVAITVWQSGGLRFWPGREVVVWDALDPEWLDRGLAWLAAGRRPAAIVMERWEEEGFRRRFAGQTYGALDWPPRYAVDRRVRIFLPADRARYLAGQPVPTDTVFAPRRDACRSSRGSARRDSGYSRRTWRGGGRTMSDTSTVTVRRATRADGAAIARIYNEGIRGRGATFETRERTPEDIARWFDDARFPILVAEEHREVVAWAAASAYRARACYAGIAEYSIYVATSHHGRGIGHVLMPPFLEALEQAGFWKVLSRLFPENAASRALCARHGFREVGMYRRHATAGRRVARRADRRAAGASRGANRT